MSCRRTCLLPSLDRAAQSTEADTEPLDAPLAARLSAGSARRPGARTGLARIVGVVAGMLAAHRGLDRLAVFSNGNLLAEAVCAAAVVAFRVWNSPARAM